MAPSLLQTRSRGWCFTVNNYKQEDEDALIRVQYKYLVYGHEVGESGTPHLQGFIYFTNARTGKAIKQLLPKGAHFEKQKGTVDQAADYCKKENDFVESGEKPCNQEEKGQRGKEAASWAIKKAREGDLQAIEDEQPKIFLQYGPRLESLRVRNTEPLATLEHEWWIGPTGTGKSKTLWKLYGAGKTGDDRYYNKDICKWWDGYRNQQVVAIEEWSPDVVPGLIQKLKKWADHNPFNGEIKGGTLLDIRPKKIIVLSNYSIEQCFPRIEDYEPLSRRFKVIRFPEEKETAIFRSHLQAIETSLHCDEVLEEEPETDLPDLSDIFPAEDLITDEDLPTWNWTALLNQEELLDMLPLP